jgi:hypothetical protein
MDLAASQHVLQRRRSPQAVIDESVLDYQTSHTGLNFWGCQLLRQAAAWADLAWWSLLPFVGERCLPLLG